MNGFGGENQQLSNDFLYTNLASDNKQTQAQLQNLGNGLCAVQYENATQFGNLKADLADCCCTTQRAIDAVNFNVSREVAGLQSSIDNCCCETQKGIMQSTYAITDKLNSGFNSVERGICDLGYNLTNAIHADGEATRALINQNTMQDLRDRLDQAQSALISSSQTNALQAQLSEILCKIPQAPIPAYVVPFPPYTQC